MQITRLFEKSPNEFEWSWFAWKLLGLVSCEAEIPRGRDFLYGRTWPSFFIHSTLDCIFVYLNDV